MNKSSKWIKFLGGRNLIFTLVVIILTAVALLLVQQLDFIFYPITVILSNVLIPLVIATIFYYLFNPVITFFERKGVPRVLAIAILYIVLALLLVWGLSAAIPSLIDQIESFLNAFPTYIEQISNAILPQLERVAASDEFSQVVLRLQDWIGSLPEKAMMFLQNGLTGLSSVVSSVTNVVVTMVFVPIVLFFLLKDDQEFAETFISIVPPAWRKNLIRIGKQMSEQVGSYVQGQLLVAAAEGLMVYIGFKIIGLNYAGILAIATGLLSVIPYIGATLSFIPALIVAAFDSWFMVLKLIIVWVIAQFVEGNILQPNIMGQQLSIHPLTIMVVLFVAGDIMGVFGMIFGVPIYAILKVLVVYWFQKFKDRYNHFFGQEGLNYESRDLPEAFDDRHEDAEEIIEKVMDEDETEDDVVKG